MRSLHELLGALSFRGRAGGGHRPAAGTWPLRKGEAPTYLVDEAIRFLQTGICFPRTGMTKKMRRELGLPEGEVTERRGEGAGEIARRTGLGRLILE